MTVKQFAYLATGIVMAWVLLQLPISIFIKFPFSFFSAILGIGLAFLPVSGRPMDAMIGNFIKAILRPTQFVYEKAGGQLYFPHTGIPLRGVLPFQQKDKLKVYLESQVTVSNITTAPSFTPNINPVPAAVAIAEPPVKNLLKPVSTGFNRNIGLPDTPNSPNLITGITKDARGNALSNILVEVKDQEGNPVRAFKTNEFGRFTSATPLINGNYTIEFEDPKAQNRFEKGTINVTGQIIQPIEAISLDTREELRRSLFNTI